MAVLLAALAGVLVAVLVLMFLLVLVLVLVLVVVLGAVVEVGVGGWLGGWVGGWSRWLWSGAGVVAWGFGCNCSWRAMAGGFAADPSCRGAPAAAEPQLPQHRRAPHASTMNEACKSRHNGSTRLEANTFGPDTLMVMSIVNSPGRQARHALFARSLWPRVFARTIGF